MKWNEKLKKLRGERSIMEIAESINASPDVYEAYERGDREPKPLVKKDISDFFGVKTSEIWNE